MKLIQHHYQILLLSLDSIMPGPSFWSVIALWSTGHIPVCLNPAWIFLMVIAFFQQGTNTPNHSLLIILHTQWLCTKSLTASYHLFLNEANGTSSRGWRTCVVWEGRARTMMLLSFINFMNWQLNVCELCESIKSRFFLLFRPCCFRYSMNILPYL